MTKYHDKPGKGRKHCGGCNRYVGVRTKTCGCGFTFQTGLESKVKNKKVKARKRKQAPKKQPEVEQEEEWVKPRWLIYAPAGKPKVTLEGHTRAKVKDWLVKTRSIARSEGMEFSPGAFKYYITYFYKILTPEYKKCLRMIDRILEEEKQNNA